MPRTYDNITAICPFFKTSNKREITCEGVAKNSIIKLGFPSELSRSEYKETCCDSNYHSCGVCKMLIEKYAK